MSALEAAIFAHRGILDHVEGKRQGLGGYTIRCQRCAFHRVLLIGHGPIPVSSPGQSLGQ